MDQIGMIKPISKGAWMAPSAAELPMLVARALRTAVSGVPGPVHITLPYDVLHQQVDEADARMPTPADFAPRKRPATDGAVTRAIDLLAAAKRPMLLAGPSAWRGATGEKLQKLLNHVGMAALPIDSAVGLGEPSIHGLGSELSRSDLIFLLTPQDFTINFAAPPTFPEGVPIVQAAPRQSEIGRNRRVDVSLIGDQATIVDQILSAAQTRAWPSTRWRTEFDDLREERRASTSPFENADDAPIHPMRVMAAVRDALRPGDSIALDGGEFVRWARWTFGGGPYELITSGKLGALGSGIPFANAAALARPDRRSVAFIGDGTFGFHGMELDTAVRHDLPLVVIVGNDAGWATERHRQRAVYGPDRLVAADLLPTRYDVVAQGLGAHGEYVERPEQLRPALERAFASGKPACINVMIASLRAPATGA
jgi:acetolactate synthase-1/2/3 large subunit